MRRGVFATLMRPWYKILLRSLIGERHAMPNFRVCPCHSCDDGATARRTPLDYTFYVRSVVSFLVSMKTYYIATITYIATNVVPYRSMTSYHTISVNHLKITDAPVGPQMSPGCRRPCLGCRIAFIRRQSSAFVSSSRIFRLFSHTRHACFRERREAKETKWARHERRMSTTSYTSFTS